MMLKHVLIVAWRNICKYKVSAGIGVMGLTMGLLCFVLCNFCARLLFSTDKVFPNSPRIAEVQLKLGEENQIQSYFAGTPPTLSATLESDFPGQVECFTTVPYWERMNATFEKDDKKSMVYLIHTIEVDYNFQKVFSCRLIQGNWEQMFRQKNAVVLSRSAAHKIYGDQNPMGKVFHLNESKFKTSGDYSPEELAAFGYTSEELAAVDYTVMGVMEDLPVNTSLSFLMPIEALIINDQYGAFAKYKQDSGDAGCTTFALLRPGVTKEEVNQRINPGKYRIFVGGRQGGIPEFLNPGQNSLEAYKRIGYFYLCIGFLILLVAVLNFFTFITGTFFNRLKEYNIRRGIGSSRWQLLGLLWAETLILLLAAGIMVACLLELFYDRLDLSLTARKIIFQPKELYVQLLQYLGVGVVICLAVCWGITERLSHKYIRITTGHSSKTGKQGWRNLMLGVQLVICFLFFTTGVAVYLQSGTQMKSIFPFLSVSERENILEINLNDPGLKGLERDFIGRFKQISGVIDALPMDDALFGLTSCEMVKLNDRYLEFKEMKVGPNFASFLNLPMLQGQVFQEPGQVVVDRDIDQLYGGGLIDKGFENVDGMKINVSGVVEAIPKLHTGGWTACLWRANVHPTWCYLKVWPGSREKVMADVQQILNEVIPETIAHRIPTLEEVVRRQNHMHEQTKSMLLFFTVVCLLITVLGMYAAISIDTHKRRKEMAIRKINGIPTVGIVKLFVGLYLKLLLIAIVITFPVLWWLIQEWLSKFPIRFYPGVEFWIFILFVMVIIIVLTISWKIREIIRKNPVEALREE